MLNINSLAPDFFLEDKNGQSHQLGDYRGQWILLYFYPKDNTPGCTAEACSIRDNWHDFEAKRIKVIGISSDSKASHKKFISDHKLPFLLLSDPDKQVIKDYDAKGMFTKRISYLIDPQGVIVKAYPKVNPLEHASEVLRDVVSAR